MAGRMQEDLVRLGEGRMQEDLFWLGAGRMQEDLLAEGGRTQEDLLAGAGRMQEDLLAEGGSVPNSKSRNIPEVVIVRRGPGGALGIWGGRVSWVKGGANGVSLQAT